MKRALLFLCCSLSAWGAPREERLVVFAASSLSQVLPNIGEAWQTAGGLPLELHFDASSRLAVQLEYGAQADVLFTADVEWMEHAASKRIVDPSTQVALLSNALVVIVPAQSTASFSSAGSLKTASFRHLALGGENVPAGKYARAALQHLGVWNSIQNRVVNGANVRQVLELVALRQADVGVVYETDARVEPRVKVVWRLPASSHPDIVYPVAATRTAKSPDAARRFIAFCQQEQAARIFEAAGFRRLAKGKR